MGQDSQDKKIDKEIQTELEVLEIEGGQNLKFKTYSKFIFLKKY